MNLTKLASKRGRPKRKTDQNSESSESFSKKKVARKLSKTAQNSKKNKEKTKNAKKKNDQKKLLGFSESDSDDSQESVEMKEQNKIKTIPITIEFFNCDKMFLEILNRANKEPEFLIMMKNLLSGCSRSLVDKKNQLNKKWTQLRNSNCTQDEYLSREAELKRIQFEEIYEMERDIMTKLSYANIKGFMSKETLIAEYKQNLLLQGTLNSERTGDEIQYYIEDDEWNKYHEEQKKLLDLLMKENDFVSQMYTPSNIIRTYSEPVKNTDLALQGFQDNEMDVKFNNIETEENPEATKFFFCQQYDNINYQKIFQGSNPFKVAEADIFNMDPQALGWILETKSDEIYTNDKFQKETFKKYTEMLQQIYKEPELFPDEEIIEKLLEVAAYILNSVHYYQKFKLKCDLLHPLDLLLVIQKIKKSRKAKESLIENQPAGQERLEKELRDISESIKSMEEMKQVDQMLIE